MYTIRKETDTKLRVMFTLHKEGHELPFTKSSYIKAPKKLQFTGEIRCFPTESKKEFIAFVTCKNIETDQKLILMLTSKKLSFKFTQFTNCCSGAMVPQNKLNGMCVENIISSQIYHNVELGTRFKQKQRCIVSGTKLSLVVIDNMSTPSLYTQLTFHKYDDRKWELKRRKNLTFNLMVGEHLKVDSETQMVYIANRQKTIFDPVTEERFKQLNMEI